jgi:hypothetical protein
MRSSNRLEAFFLTSLCLIFVSATIGLALDLVAIVESSAEEEIGTVVFRQRRADRKFTEQVLWTSLPQGSPVNNRDTIRTASDSAATIYLKDGTRISLDEETMILIDIRREESRLDVSGGAIIVSRAPAFVPAAVVASDPRAANTSTPSGTADGATDLTRPRAPVEVFQAPEITIVTRLGKVIVEEGSLALRDDGRQVSVAVNSGSAVLSTAAGRATLDVAQSATIEETGAVVGAVALSSTLPAQGFEILSASDAAFVDFEWMASIGFVGTLTIATNPDFRNVVDNAPVAGTKATLMLGVGVYYWRVEGEGQETKPRRLSVTELVSPGIIDTAQQRISYRGDRLPLVDLTWFPAYPKTDYLVEASVSKAFSPVAISTRTSSTSLSVTPPADGVWFWRARALYPSSGLETSTQTASFIVERMPVEAPVLRGAPSTPIRASALSILTGGTVISWDIIEGADAYLVTVAHDEPLTRIVYQRRSIASSAKLDARLDPGQYWVAVSAEANGMVSPPSAPRSLIVANPEPITLVSPSVGAALPAGTVLADASWRDPNGLGRYVVELAPDKGFSAVVANTEVVGTRGILAIPNGSSGTLYWRVVRIDDNGESLLVSAASNIWLPWLMESPIQHKPRDGEGVDVFYSSTIDFSWEGVSSANYYLLKLNRMLSGNPVLLREWTTTETSLSLSDLSMLAEGNYAWDIIAYDKREETIFGSSELSRAYFKIVQSKEVEAPVIELPKRIYVK